MVLNYHFSSYFKIIYQIASKEPKLALDLVRHLLNTFMCDMFGLLHPLQFSAKVDGNTIFAVKDSINNFVSALQEAGIKLLIWFSGKSSKVKYS